MVKTLSQIMINIGNVWSIITSKRETISLSRSKEYGGVETLYVPSERIWLPDIVLYNNAGKEIMPTMYFSILPSKLALAQSYLTLKITSMYIFIIQALWSTSKVHLCF